jgi:hypothetical protein
VGSCADRCSVLGETAAAPPEAAAEELRADAVVKADSVGDLVGVDAEFLADIQDILDEAYFRIDKRVVVVLDTPLLLDRSFDNGGVSLFDQWQKHLIQLIAVGILSAKPFLSGLIGTLFSISLASRF